jgi:hypothetical protein
MPVTRYKNIAGQPHPLASLDLSDELKDGFDAGYADTLEEIRAMRGLDTSDIAEVPTAAADYAHERAGELITQIDDTTREDIADMVAQAQEDGLSDTELADQLGESFLFDDARAQLIARTEGATAWNMGTVQALRDAGEDYVVVSDPCECGQPECDVDGQIWTLDEAEAEPIGHPNCGRDFRPLTEEELAEVQAEEAAGEEGSVEDALAASAQFYSEDQPRDEKGRWSHGDVSATTDAAGVTTLKSPAGAMKLDKKETPGYAFIRHVKVDKPGQGHGLALYEAAMKWARDHGLKGLSSDPNSRSSRAQDFWEKLADHGADIEEGRDYHYLHAFNAQLFYSEDQPRDERGRWEGGGSSDVARKALEDHIVDLKADRALTGPDSKDITDLVKGTSRTTYLSVPGINEMHDRMGLHPTMNTPPFEYQKARDALFAKLPLEQVAVKDLTFTQPRINVPRVNDLSRLPGQLSKPVQVVSVNGRNYLMNGHHRVAAASVAGMSHITANVLKLSHAKFYSEDQERDEKGRWTSGGATLGEWAQGTKVVDAAGDPLVVFHGTKREFTQFEGVSFFTDDPAQASNYAGGHGPVAKEGANVVPVYLAIKNPATVPFIDFLHASSSLIDRLKAEGHDGLIIQNRAMPLLNQKATKWYVPFDHTQIRNAITHKTMSAEAFWSEDQPRGENGRWIREGDASSLGGTVKKEFYRDVVTGKRHLFKPDNEKKVLAAAAASHIARIANPRAAETQVVTIGGHTGLMQQFIPGTPLDRHSLSPEDIHQLQREHVIDWATSQHDSHPAQFIRDEHGGIVSLDKSQAWKHLGSDRLSERYHPNAAYGERPPLYNTLFRPGSPALAHVDPEAIRSTVDALKGISREHLGQILGPYAKASGRGEAFIDKAHERLQNAGRHFEDHYTRLLGRQVKFYSEDQPRDEDGKWTTGGAEAAPLSKEQASALHNYQHDGYRDINGVLRGSGEARSLSENAKRIVRGRVAALDAAIAAAPPLTEEATVYRGMTLRAGFVPEVGATFTDRGFVSTSMAERVASGFREEAPHTAVVEIHLPVGTKALRVEAASKRSNANMRNEKEVLVHRGATFEVKSVTGDAKSGYRLVVGLRSKAA